MPSSRWSANESCCGRLVEGRRCPSATAPPPRRSADRKMVFHRLHARRGPGCVLHRPALVPIGNLAFEDNTIAVLDNDTNGLGSDLCIPLERLLDLALDVAGPCPRLDDDVVGHSDNAIELVDVLLGRGL